MNCWMLRPQDADDERRMLREGRIWLAAPAADRRLVRDRMTIGDLLVLHRDDTDTVTIGRVTGPPAHRTDPAAGPTHARSVRWLRSEAPRAELDRRLLAELAEPGTVGRITARHAVRRLAAVIEAAPPPAAAGPWPSWRVPRSGADSRAALEPFVTGAADAWYRRHAAALEPVALTERLFRAHRPTSEPDPAEDAAGAASDRPTAPNPLVRFLAASRTLRARLVHGHDPAYVVANGRHLALAALEWHQVAERLSLGRGPRDLLRRIVREELRWWAFERTEFCTLEARLSAARSGDGHAAIAELWAGDIVGMVSFEAIVGTTRPRPRSTATALRGPALDALIARGLVRVTNAGVVLPTLEGAVLDAFLASDPREIANASPSPRDPRNAPASQETAFARVQSRLTRSGFDASTFGARFGIDPMPHAGPLTVEEAVGLIAHLHSLLAAATGRTDDTTAGPGTSRATASGLPSWASRVRWRRTSKEKP